MESTETMESIPLTAPPAEIPKTARDILLSKAGEFVVQATQKRAAGEDEDALSLYQRSAEILIAIINNETDPDFKAKLERQLREVLDSKDTLTQEQKVLKDLPQTNLERKDSTSCEVVVSIENISIHQVRALGEQSQERKLLGKGTLRILKCQTSGEELNFNTPPKQAHVETKSEAELDELLERDGKPKAGLYLLQLVPDEGETQFQFPLTKSIPCLCTSPGYYIFPTAANVFYGIVFPSDIPQPYTHVFEKVLDDCCTLRKVSVPPGFHPGTPAEPQEMALTTISTSNEIIVAPLPLAAKAFNAVSAGINTGASVLVEGITTGSQYIAATAKTGGEFIRRNITPTPEPAKVPDQVVSTVYVAGQLSPMCVAVSKVIISSVASLAEEIGRTVGNGIAKATGPKKLSANGPTATAAKEMGKTSLQAVVNIWDALEEAGKLILSETSTQTVKTVEKKYGPQAAEVTKESMRVTGDIIETAYNLDQLGVKKIAKRAVAKSSKQAVKSMLAIEGSEQLALPAPEEKLALPAPEEKLALPAPEEKLALPAPGDAGEKPTPSDENPTAPSEEKLAPPSEENPPLSAPSE